jgi:hypothetical protein
MSRIALASMQSAIFIERPDGIPACARFSDCLPPNQPLER